MPYVLTDLAHQLRIVPRFVRLLPMAIYNFLLWTLLGLVYDPISFVPETLTAINPLVAQDVTVAASAFEPSLDFFGGVRLIGIIVVGGCLGILLFWLVVEGLI